LFEDQVERTPDHIAAVYENQQLTYGELNQKARQLARVLNAKGIRPDDIVCVMAGRSLEMIIGIMAILKAGGAYLPIDPGYPVERIKFMLEDSQSAILLTSENFANLAEPIRGICKINLDDATIYDAPDETNSKSKSEPGVYARSHTLNLAYVIYTSGSTGKPKGVMIEHRSVINRLYWMQKRYPLRPDDIILQKTPYSRWAYVASYV
jgi:non-ribosomal peptide synthetase component F